MNATSRSMLVCAGFGLLCVLLVVASSPLGTDYSQLTQRILERLSSGDLTAYFGEQPQMGQLSLLLRAPAGAFGGGDLLVYQLGSALCLFGPLGLAVALSRGLDLVKIALICVALIANPVTMRALELGHPEELLCAALCAGALLAAINERATWAAAFLGLALATKQWALLAVLPVLFAVGRDQLWRTLGITSVIAAAFTLPPLIVDPDAFRESLRAPASGVIELRPGNLWSLVIGPQAHVSLGGGDTAAITNVPRWLRHSAHPATLVICLALAVGLRPLVRRPVDLFAVLALVFLARCVLDPWNHEYYHAPFLMSLCCWEVLAARRSPLLTVASSAILWLIFARIASTSGASLEADVMYIAWATAAAVVLAYALVSPNWVHTALRRTRPAQSPRAAPPA